MADCSLCAPILALSHRLAQCAPAIKPFVRFSPALTPAVARQFWDFDDLVQKTLLAILRELASPDDIEQASVTQWHMNLEALYIQRYKMLEAARETDIQFPLFDTPFAKQANIISYLKPGSRVLYIGAGSGTECLQMAHQGFHVVGIDPVVRLLQVGQQWARHLDRTADFVGMNSLALGFRAASFDAVFIEFYGLLPSLRQTITLQRELARVLKPDGEGLISASRKKYASYWWFMGSLYPAAMIEWLIPQASLDFHYSESDSAEETLKFGLYHASHTPESLAAELSHTFTVAQSVPESDPRYLLAVVRPKAPAEWRDPVKWHDPAPLQPLAPERSAQIDATLYQVEQLCDFLETHTNRVVAWFEAGETQPLEQLAPDMDYFVALLEHITGSQ